MKLDAVGVVSGNLGKTVQFYSVLGFEFPEHKPDEDHLEPVRTEGSARLMIDSVKLMTDLMKETPRPSNHSAFALQYDSPDEVNAVTEKIKQAGFKVNMEPWDAFWGQRYAVVEDPDGYKVDLYAWM